MELPSYRIIEGRRPVGLVAPVTQDGASVLGDYFARAAYLEAASAIAYARVGRELATHGAPDTLLDACDLAREAELRHAKLLGRLAQRHGVRPTTPRPQTVRVRPLAEVALDNIVEGCVRATYGAAAARFRAGSAHDAEVARVMAEIAGDECIHAELAFDLAVWLQGAIDPIEAVWVEDTMRHAVVGLARDLDVDVEPELCDGAGVPSRGDALAIWSGLSKRVWRNLSECVWSAAAA